MPRCVQARVMAEEVHSSTGQSQYNKMMAKQALGQVIFRCGDHVAALELALENQALVHKTFGAAHPLGARRRSPCPKSAT